MGILVMHEWLFSISGLVRAVVVVTTEIVTLPDAIDFPKAPAATESDFQTTNSLK